MKLKDACSLEEKLWQHIIKQRHYLTNKVPFIQSFGFSSSHVWMWELDYNESWAPKNWCLWTVVLEKTLESPLDCKEIQPIHPKGVSRKTDTEAESPTLSATWWEELTHWKRPCVGKDLRQEEKGMTKVKIVGWHHQHSGYEFELFLGVGDAQGGLACYSPWRSNELDTMEWLDWLTDWIESLTLLFCTSLSCKIT